MRKLLKKKVNIFGKTVPVFVLVLLGLGLVSAALIPYFAQITGLVTVDQGLTVDGKPWSETIVEDNVMMYSLEAKTVFSAVHTLTNTAGVEALVDLNTVCVSNPAGDGCDNIATNYVSTDDVIATADRLLLLQDTDGSWDWVVTGASGPTGTSLLNIAGVTAQGLLTAYEITGESKYLNAAIKTGDYLILQYGAEATMFGSTGRINAFNIKFLYDLGSVAEDKYTTEANRLMNIVITAYPTALDLLTANVDYRGPSIGNGIAIWDLYNYVENAESFGDSVWASELTDAIDDFVLDTDGVYTLGLAGKILATGNSVAVNDLISVQQSGGYFTNPIWPNEDIQPTAYAIMALMSAGEYGHALEAQIWLAEQSSNGVWLEDTAEYAEVDSEAIQALPSMTLPIIVGTEPVRFTISSYFPQMMKPAEYTITTTVTA